MSFEIVQPGAFKPADALKSGEVSVSRNATLTVLAENLSAVGIGERAIVLADSGSLRIGFRKVRDREQAQSVGVSVIRRGNKADSGRRRILISRAIKHLGLTPEACSGRYTLNTHRDELIFIVLTEARDIPLPQESKPS